MSDRWVLRGVDYHREDVWRPFSQVSEPREMAVADGLQITADGQDVRCTDPGGRLRWEYHCAGKPTEAQLSDDRLLVLTDSLECHPWGFLGPAVLLDLADGSVVAELRGNRAGAAGGGRFVVGLAGYSVFDTWLHDRDGRVLSSWRSAGHYIVDPNGSVRVVESGRGHPVRVVRLLPGGEIKQGPRLLDSQVPRPVVLADGTAVVLDAGLLRGVDRDLVHSVLAKLRTVSPDQHSRYHGALELDGDRLSVVVRQLADDPSQGWTHHWTFQVIRS